MRTQSIPVNQPEIIFNRERELLKNLLLKADAILDSSLSLNNECIQIRTKQVDAGIQRVVDIASDLVVECLPSEFKQGMKGQPAAKTLDSKEKHEQDKKVESAKLVYSFYDRLTDTLKSITKPMRELLDYRIDDELHKFYELYNLKLIEKNFEQKANNALSDLSTLLAKLQKNPPAINSPNPEITNNVRLANVHIDNLANCSRILVNIYGKLEKICALREQVKQPSFDIKSISVEDVRNHAIYCDQLRGEFLSLRDNQLNGFVANWKSKIDAVKKSADSISKSRNELMAKLSVFLPTHTVKEEAKVATNMKPVAVAVR